MIRTNPSVLSFIDDLYKANEHKENIQLKSFSNGQFLLQQGQQVARTLVIKEGITKCFLSEENDKDYIVEFLGEGEILGDIEVIRNIKCLCSIQAITPVKVYLVSIPFFQSLMNENLEFNKLLLGEFAERIINTSTRASFQQLYTVESGLAKLLDLQAKQHIAISKEDMAAYLGVTIRSLNRALKNLK
jgi:CRP-like cAMP-binding protein